MTTHDRREPRLSEAAEALLDGWPAPPRGALEWEDVATRTMRRVQETAKDSTDDALLAPPLPVEPGDGDLAAELGLREDEAPGLAQIARAAVAAKAAEAARDVAKEMLAAAAGSRAQAPAPPPSRIEAGFSAARPKMPSAPEVVQAVHEAASPSELPRSRPLPQRKEEKKTATPIWLGGGAALALAAGAVLYVSMRTAREPVATLQASAEAPAVIAAAPPAAPGAMPAPPTTTEPEREKALALGDLPPGNTKNAAETPAPKAVARSAGAAKDGLAFHVGGDKKTEDKLVLEERPEEGAAVAANSPPVVAQKPAPAAAPDDVAPQPSVGAVQAAIGSVMGGARSCLAGQEESSRAKVVFSSNGHVTSVTLTGPAAGTPAESCVRSALMGARVPPFGEPTFSASITVRPP